MLFNSVSDIFLIMQALMTKNFLLEKKNFTTPPKKWKMQNFVPIFFISDTTFCHMFVCFPRTKKWPHTLKKYLNGAVVTTKTILNVIMTQFGIFGVIMLALAHCFEIF